MGDSEDTGAFEGGIRIVFHFLKAKPALALKKEGELVIN